jgi:MFS family permease
MAILVHDLTIGLTGFTIALFFLGVAIAPLWTATMDIAPNYAGSSSALMNAAGAVAGIFSPVAFGWILERTGSWTMPFGVSVGLLLFAIVMTYWIKPDRPIAAVPRVDGWWQQGDRPRAASRRATPARDHALVRQDVVDRDQIFDECRACRSGLTVANLVLPAA